jgi:hypothetical protein
VRASEFFKSVPSHRPRQDGLRSGICLRSIAADAKALLPGGLPGMTTGRIEAFSDGVLAIIIIIVLELKMPERHDAALWRLPPILLS